MSKHGLVYVTGQRVQRHRRRYGVLVLFGTAGILAIIIGLQHLLTPDTVLSSSKGTVRTIKVVPAPTKRVATATFTMDVPKTWEKTTTNRIPTPAFAWRGTDKDEQGRAIEIYVDTIPKNLAVNRLLPLEAHGNQLLVSGAASPNCMGFADTTKLLKAAGTIAASWHGANFVCDAGNTERNVTGTSSSQAINSVTVRGSHTGVHRYLFLYTDHSAQADDQVFVDILQSFRAR